MQRTRRCRSGDSPYEEGIVQRLTSDPASRSVVEPVLVLAGRLDGQHREAIVSKPPTGPCERGRILGWSMRLVGEFALFGAGSPSAHPF
jgi:hypothetical protein